MNAFRRTVTLTEAGRLVVEGLPFESGQRVEVVVLAEESPATLGAELQSLLMETQALPQARTLTEEELRDEIAAYRAGR